MHEVFGKVKFTVILVLVKDFKLIRNTNNLLD